MAITEFGKAVRHARLNADINLSTMAEQLGVSAAFLSSLESGRKNISDEWVQKIEAFFESKGTPVQALQELADLSNKTVPLEGLAPEHQRLVTAFARTTGTPDLLAQIEAILKKGI